MDFILLISSLQTSVIFLYSSSVCFDVLSHAWLYSTSKILWRYSHVTYATQTDQTLLELQFYQYLCKCKTTCNLLLSIQKEENVYLCDQKQISWRWISPKDLKMTHTWIPIPFWSNTSVKNCCCGSRYAMKKPWRTDHKTNHLLQKYWPPTLWRSEISVCFLFYFFH